MSKSLGERLSTVKEMGWVSSEMDDERWDRVNTSPMCLGANMKSRPAGTA